jgi:uncharacterized RDD family membrane protein YckC
MFPASFNAMMSQQQSASPTTQQFGTSLTSQQFVGDVTVLIWIVVALFYYGVFWSASGRTPGYLMTGLRAVRRDGSPMSVGAALLRYVGYLLCSLTCYVGFLWMLWDPRQETWAEKLSATMVIPAGEKR